MKIEITNELFYELKDKLMPLFLKEDIVDLEMCINRHHYIGNIKDDKKLIKAYNRILKYYGVDNG